MQSVEAMSERTLYWLSLDAQVRALAERLLHRFAVTVGGLPASAAHHHAKPAARPATHDMEAPLSVATDQRRIDTLVSSKTFPKQNFFAARRSFLPTRWALGDRGAEFGALKRVPTGHPGTAQKVFVVGANFCRLDGH